MKKVFLDDFKNEKGLIQWDNIIGHFIKFIYEEIEDEFFVIGKEGNKFVLLYKNNEFKFLSSCIYRCNFGVMLGLVNCEFKYKIGENLKDDKKDITIINNFHKKIKKKNNKIVNNKWVEYKCNKCSYIGEKAEVEVKNSGCPCCDGKIVVKGINDIATTNPELLPLFVNIEDAYTHTRYSGKKVLTLCPYCGEKKLKECSRLDINNYPCKCGDSISYPEKFMMNILTQLNIDYTYQLNKSFKKWCKEFKYDFYFKLDNKEYIIETHGKQHYQDKTTFKKTLKETQQNDLNKYELAISNGIKPENYIVIDFRESTLQWGKEHIIDSKLNEIFDLDNIDWLQCEECALKNIVKEVCDYWHKHYEINKENINFNDLEKVFKLSSTTLRNYVKKGTKLNWCNYDKQEFVKDKIGKSNRDNTKKYKLFINEEEFEGEYSIREFIDIFSEKYGENFTRQGIETSVKRNTLYKNKYKFKLVK